MPTPEELARKNIDKQLAACGWTVQSRSEMNLYAGRGVAVREFPLATGEADYLLFVDRKAMGVVEAKPEGVTLSGVADQAAKYSVGLPSNIPHVTLPLPFLYESTGVETFFRDERDPEPRSRRIFTFHRPEELADWVDEGSKGTAESATSQGLGADRRALTLRGRLRDMPTQFPLITTGLWGAQIKAIVDVMRPQPRQTICDPAAGTGGFLLATHDYIARHNTLDRDQWDHLRHQALHGWEIVDNTARLCVMNLYLHGIGSFGDGSEMGRSPIHVADSLASSHPGEYFDMVLTNPPFGKKSSVTFVTDEGESKRESQNIVREDSWTSTSNKQLNFVQHVRNILHMNGKAAVVVPDNVLFEGGAGEVVRRKLLHECDVHTLLRLPTGIFYAQGVKANVLFFDRKLASESPWTKQLWIYDLRTNMDFTLKTNPLARVDLNEFVERFRADNRFERTSSWSPSNDTGRWRSFTYEELLARDKVNLDIFWLRDESLEDSANLPNPDVLAAEIVEDLRSALTQFEGIAEELGEDE